MLKSKIFHLLAYRERSRKELEVFLVSKGYDIENINKCLDALEKKTSMPRDDVINFFDNNQMFDLIKFMVEHEMGSETFNKYYPPGNQQFLDAMIMEGYDLGINSYGGKLGKIR